jgi:hypothetical protein
MAKDIPVYYQEYIIGKVYNSKLGLDEKITIHFTLNESDLAEQAEEIHEHLVSLLNISCNTIRCVMCGNYFETGQSPCDCIQDASIIEVDGIKIVGITLIESPLDEQFVALKNNVLQSFFAGSMANLIIAEDM